MDNPPLSSEPVAKSMISLSFSLFSSYPMIFFRILARSLSTSSYSSLDFDASRNGPQLHAVTMHYLKILYY